jgi:hypothetical protein
MSIVDSLIKLYFTVTNHTTFEESSDIIKFYANVQLSLICMSIVVIVLAFLYNFIYKIFDKKKNFFKKTNMFLNILFNSLLFFFAFLKFYLALVLEKCYNVDLLQEKVEFYKHNKSFTLDFFCIFSTSLGDAIYVLCVLTGIVCLDVLGGKDLFKKISNVCIFYLFTLLVILMVSTNNLFFMFICFEFMFLPTIYFVYELGYMKKTEKSGFSLFC